MGSQLSSDKCGKAVLVLEDGSYFVGQGFGAASKVSREIVFARAGAKAIPLLEHDISSVCCTFDVSTKVLSEGTFSTSALREWRGL